MIKNILFWIIAAIITMAAAVFQRLTGPTYPIKGEILLQNKTIRFKLPRSIEIGSQTQITVPIVDGYSAFIAFKRYKTSDSLIIEPMKLINEHYSYQLPDLPPAGKYAYNIFYKNNAEVRYLCKHDIIVRYKGEVPEWILILHILFMFGGMLLSNYTGILALRKHTKVHYWAKLTIIFIFIGGFILGPIVQKYAFNEFWAGFPYGYDLTDNKVLLSFIFWIIALLLYKKYHHPRWYFIACIVTFIIYLIPHSLYGSELDFSTGTIKQG
ncbi:MAG: hypothetical protein N2449_00670 [Bacteroidales bacterium]|nr:hypothetical protein [Bacteroidales bacterium]